MKFIKIFRVIKQKDVISFQYKRRDSNYLYINYNKTYGPKCKNMSLCTYHFTLSQPIHQCQFTWNKNQTIQTHQHRLGLYGKLKFLELD